MFSILTCRTLQRRPIQGIGHTSVHAMLAALLLITSQVVSALAAANFERPPVLDVTQLVPAKLLKGQGFRVETKVPTDGIMGTYTLIADKETFGEDAGTYEVRSREMLELRLSEIPAIIKLDETSKTKTFVTAMGATAVKPLESAGHMVMHPVETATGLPGGVGRLFGRVGAGAGHLWNTATDSEKGGFGEAAEQTGTITKDALGYEQERRELAKKLGVDPYTTNPILKKKLDEIATVAFYGHVGVNTAISVAVPASLIITGVRVTDNLVWDTPRGDLIVRVEDKLQELQVPKAQISAFTHNPAIPLSLQVAVVENLGRLSNVPGRRDVVRLMGSVEIESQARFLATSLRMLLEYHDKKKPITAVAAPGPLIGQDRDGMLILPAPVDYVSWTERVASFAKSPSFLAVPQRTLWLVGQMSPRANKEFAANGWTVQVEKPH
jgi:hypothetical protein